jgi:hypothetical protein
MRANQAGTGNLPNARSTNSGSATTQLGGALVTMPTWEYWLSVTHSIRPVPHAPSRRPQYHLELAHTLRSTSKCVSPWPRIQWVTRWFPFASGLARGNSSRGLRIPCAGSQRCRNCRSASIQCSRPWPCSCPRDIYISWALVPIASCDRTIVAIFRGLGTAASAIVSGSDFEAPRLREAGVEVLCVAIVITMFLIRFMFVAGPLMRLRHWSAGDKRGVNTPSGGSRTPGKLCSVSTATLPDPGARKPNWRKTSQPVYKSARFAK